MRAMLGTWWSRGIAALTSTIDARFPPPPEQRPTLYLTFDDGPTDAGTPALLEVLERFTIPATFFLVGNHARALPQRVAEIVSAGHEIGNHSFSHIDAWKSSGRATIADFCRASRILEDLQGAPLRLMRPPFGRVTPALARWAIRKQQRLTLWDVMPPDFQANIAPARVSRGLLNGPRSGSIVCLHDNPQSERVTPGALAECIPQMLVAGWNFATLPGINRPRENAAAAAAAADCRS